MDPPGCSSIISNKTFGFEHLSVLEHHATDWLTPVVGTLVGVLGLGLSYLLYANPSPIPGQLATRLGPLYQASLNKFYVDEIYSATVVKTTLVAARVVEFFDMYFIDGLVRLAAWIPRVFGREAPGAVAKRIGAVLRGGDGPRDRRVALDSVVELNRISHRAAATPASESSFPRIGKG